MTAAAVGGVMVFAGRRLGFVDRPDADGLKIHTGRPVPLGGAAVLAGLHSGMAVAGIFDLALFTATAAVWVLGLLDDRWSLDPWVRLLGGAVAGTALVLIGDLTDGPVAGVLAVLLVVVTLNAVNMLDGLDSLAGTVTAVSALGLAGLAALFDVAAPWAALFLSAALLGFLLYNTPPARLFLGDNGAYVAGVTLAWSALRIGSGWGSGLLAAAAIGVPLMELGATAARRLVSGTALFGGDRDHTYDRFHRTGWSPLRIAGFAGLAQAVWSGIVLLLASLSTSLVVVGLGLTLAVAATGVMAFWGPSGRTGAG